MHVTLGPVDEIIEAGERYREPSVDIAERHQHWVDWPWRAVPRDAGASLGEQPQLLRVAQIALGRVVDAADKRVDRAQGPSPVGRQRLDRGIQVGRLRARDLLADVVGGVNVHERPRP